MKNVVEFPKNKIVRAAPVHVEAIAAAQEKALQNHADTIVEELVEGLVAEIENYGVTIEDKAFMRDFSLTADALRASIYRSFGLDHQLHTFIDNNVKMMNRLTGELIDEDDLIDTDNIMMSEITEDMTFNADNDEIEPVDSTKK
jgi:hypothetical protein